MFKGKVAFVTGGSSGIGFGICQMFLKNHARVVLCGSTQEQADAAVAKLLEENPSYELTAMGFDVRDYAAMQAAVNRAVEIYGRIDIMVSNAGISGMGKFYDYTPEYFERVIGVNLFGCFNAAHTVAPVMKAQGGGVIIMTASNTGDYGTFSGCAYPVSKAGVIGLIRNLGRELAKDNIRVVGVGPSLVESRMTAGLTPEVKAMVAANNPQGRFVTPEEVAGIYGFLASDAAYRINAVMVPASGGGLD